MLADDRRAASVITLGSDGALLATPDGRWLAKAPLVDVVSKVGSGDSFLGRLVTALNRGKNWPEALRDGVAAGKANALLAGGGKFTLQDFEAIRKQTQVEGW